MWTYARSSFSVSASSKSFAVSGSIVKASSSRRSTRPSSDGAGGSWGSNRCRAPVATSSASRTFSIRFADPSSVCTRARPRRPETTARSSGRASPAPLRSTTIGTPGVKYGSPTSSFPRRPSSTTVRCCSSRAAALYLQEPADRQTRAGGADEKAHRQDDERRQLEWPGVDIRALDQVDVLEQDLLAEHEQDDRAERPGEAGHQTFQHERSADEPVRRAHELHHLDLAAPREDREANGVPDQDRRGDDEDDHGEDEEDVDPLRDLEQPVRGLLAVADVAYPGRLRFERVGDRFRVL